MLEILVIPPSKKKAFTPATTFFMREFLGDLNSKKKSLESSDHGFCVFFLRKFLGDLKKINK